MKKFKNTTITAVFSAERTKHCFKTDQSAELAVCHTNYLNKYPRYREYLEQALKQEKGYFLFSNDQHALDVKLFDLWEDTYRGIFTLLAIALALVSVFTYSLYFFSSSETEKKDEVQYIK